MKFEEYQNVGISLGKMMMFAVVVGALSTTGGLALSYEPDLPAGPVIILLAGSSYILSLVVSNYRKRKAVLNYSGGQ